MAGKRYDFMDSSTEDDSISASFFIKKDPSQEEKDEDADQVNMSIESMKKLKKESNKLNKMKISSAKNSFFSDLGTTQKPMDAISRFTQLENQIKARSQNHAKLMQSLSDLDISSDDDIKKDIAQLKQDKSTKQPTTPPSGNKVTSASSSTIKTSNDQMPSPISSKDQPKLTSVMKKRSSGDSKITKSVSFDLGDSRYDDEDDDSLNSFMQNTSSTTSSSLEEIIDSKLQNLMSLDDLLPSANMLQPANVMESSSEKRTINQSISSGASSSRRTSVSSVTGSAVSSRSSDHQTNNIRTMDDLPSSVPSHSISSAKRGKNNKTNNKKKNSKKIEEKPVTNVFKLSSLSDMTSEAASVITTNEDVDQSLVSRSDTLKDTESIASEIREEYSEDASTISTYQTTSSSSTSTSTYNSSDDDDSMMSYTDDFTHHTSKSSISKKVVVKSPSSNMKKKATTTSSGVQTDPINNIHQGGGVAGGGGGVAGDLFTSFPSSIGNPSLFCSSSMLGLQDVLHQQLLLTREYIHRSNQLYDYAQRSLTANYHYTTLQETQQLIQQHRRKLAVQH